MSHNLIRVLLVEDNEDDYVITRALLAESQSPPFELEWASTYEAGLAAIARQQHDVYLVDYCLGGRTGFDILQETLNNGCERPLILLTGSSSDSVDLEAMQLGAAEFLCKDEINSRSLARTIRYAIHQRQLYQQIKDQAQREQSLVQQLQTANQELERLTMIDSLTQIANRRCFDASLDREWQRLSREQLPLTLLLGDVDYFKRYNDTYGHPAGDTCLEHIAQTFQGAVQRSTDLVARYGGEEFAILLPYTDQQGAIAVAQALLDQVQQLQIPHATSDTATYVTVSVGIATIIPGQDSLPQDLIAAADSALYQAKAQGRNQYSTATAMIHANKPWCKPAPIGVLP